MIKKKNPFSSFFTVLFTLMVWEVSHSNSNENQVSEGLKELEKAQEKKKDHSLNNQTSEQTYKKREEQFDVRGNLSGSILTCEGDESLMFGLGKKKRTRRLYHFKSPTEVELSIVYLSDQRMWLVNKNDSPTLKNFDLFYVYKSSPYSKEEKINIHYFEIDFDDYEWFPWHESINMKELKPFSVFKKMENYKCFFVDSNKKNNFLEINDKNY